MTDQNTPLVSLLTRLEEVLSQLDATLRDIERTRPLSADLTPAITSAKTRDGHGRRPDHVNQLIPHRDGERAGRLVERYQELYAKHRYGAKTRIRPVLDWHEACELVRSWDDARLEKLAILVLTTDDEWIAGTDRSFKIFATKAGWADDRLRTWERQQQEKEKT